MMLAERGMQRYSQFHRVSSPFDPFSCLLVLMEYLTVEDYVADLLISKHGVAKNDSQRRARQIRSYVRAATDLTSQALTSTPELSFLPAYYAILNLLKVSILVGPYHDQLPANRWHGATYPVTGKDSRSLLTEQIVLKRGGAIPLFYQTLTGTKLRTPSLTLSDILPFVSGVTAEYHLATGRISCLRAFRIQLEPLPDGGFQTHARLVRPVEDKAVYSPKDFKVFRHFKEHPDKKDMFVGKSFPTRVPFDDPEFRAQFRTVLLYAAPQLDIPQLGESLVTPVCSKHILWPEELGIALLFFYMSSVVRYKPEFLEKVRNSRYWPILAAARQECLLRMLALCWSQIHQQDLIVRHG